MAVLQTPLIGREKALAVFDKIANETFKKDKQSLSLLVIKGPKGVGKSRLIKEFSELAREKYQITACSWEEKNYLYTQPCLMLIDEDNISSRDEINSFLLKASSEPLLVVMVETDPHFHWPMSEEIILENFDKQETTAYLETGLNEDKLKKADINLIYEHSNGNPQAITHFISHLQNTHQQLSTTLIQDFFTEEKELEKRSRRLIAAEQLDNVSLNRQEKTILNFLSAFDRPVKESEIELTLTHYRVGALLEQLVDKNILKKTSNGLVLFVQNLVSAYIYDQLDTFEKTKIHEKIAISFRKHGNDQKETLWHEAVADPTQLEASQKLMALGELYEKEGHYRQGMRCYEKALTFNLSDPIFKARLELKYINALVHCGRFKQAKDKSNDVINELIHYSVKDDDVDPHELASILWKLNDICLSAALQAGNLEAAKERIRFVETDMASLEGSYDLPLKTIWFNNRRGQIDLKEGKLDQAERLFLRGYEGGHFLSPIEEDFLSNNDLDEVYFLQRKYDQARNICLEKLKNTSSPIQHSRCHYHLGRIAAYTGDENEALKELTTCLEIAEKHQLHVRMMMAYNEIGSLYYEHFQDYEKAKDYWLLALDIAQDSSDLASCGLIASNLGRSFNGCEDYSSAHHYLLYSIRSFELMETKSIIQLGHLTAAKIEFADCCRRLQDYESTKLLLGEAQDLIEANASLDYLRFWLYIQYFYFFNDQNISDQAPFYLEQAQKKAQLESEKQVLELALKKLDQKAPPS